MDIGKKIKEYADLRGIKYRYLAEKAGVSDSVMSKMLSDQRDINVLEYYDICKALDVPMDYFVR